MKVVELEGGESFGGEVAKVKAKRALVGVGARILFYQTLAHNLIRNKVQAEFHWWDEVDQFILLGAVPFPSDVPRLQQLGIRGVVTLNEPYDTLVPSSLYQVHGIDHLVIPTGDYLFAPSLVDIHRAVDFIHRNASCGRITYVHCKAGRGRSATIVLCYLVEHKNMTPAAALEYVRSRRPRVLLAPSQWRVVQQYSRRKSEFPAICPRSTYSLTGDEVLINEADVEGCNVGEVTKDHSSSSCEIARAGPMIVKHTPKDEVLVTEADVEGYNVGEVIIDLSNSSCKIARASPLIVKHMPKDEVLITEADVEGYNVGEVSKDFDISSCKIAKASPLIVKHMPKSAVGGDEVLVTEADLEGYDTFLNSFENKSLSSVKTSRTRKVMRKLSRLCPSLKFSAAAQPVVSWVHEIHAC